MTTQEIIDKLRFDEIAEPAMGWPLAYDVVFKGKKIAILYMNELGGCLVEFAKRGFKMSIRSGSENILAQEEKRDAIIETVKPKLAERIEWELAHPEPEKKKVKTNQVIPDEQT